jgi:YVTN family beta-propeller protein
VTSIDAATNGKISTVPAGANCSCVDPDSIAVSPNGSRVYATNELANSVSVIDAASMAVLATVSVGSGPTAVLVSPDSARVYVLNGSGATSVSILDATANVVTSTIPLGVAQARGMAISPDGSRLFVSTYGANSVKVIDTASRAILTTISVGNLPIGVAVAPNGSFVYVAAFLSNAVNVISTASNTVVASVAISGSPQNVRVTPDGSRLYVANGASSVAVINTQTNGVVATIPVSSGQRALDLTPDGTRAYVATGTNVKVIDTASNTVIATIPFDAATEGTTAAVAVGQTAGANTTSVLPGDAAWSAFLPSGTAADISARQPRSGLGSLELVSGIGATPSFSAYRASPAWGTYGDLTTLSLDWFIDPSSEAPLPPVLALRVYPFGDPRSFYLYWDTCSPNTPCTAHPTGSWRTTDVLTHLGIQQAENNTPPTSLADIPADAPIVSIGVWGNYGLGRPWAGFVDNITIGFAGQSDTRFNFEVTNPAAMRARPVITWNVPAPIPAGTLLSGAQLNATAGVPGTFVYSPVVGTSLPADVHTLGVTFLPSDAAQYQPISKIVVQTVTGTRRVLIGGGVWPGRWVPDNSFAEITGANPRSGAGSFELSKSVGFSSGANHYPFALTNPQKSAPALGTVSTLSALSFDWFIDRGSSSALPPEVALRVYDNGDPRSFFLYWDTCSASTPCDPHPIGVWQSTDLIGKLRIQSADGNLPPASLNDVPPDAPIKEVQIRASYSNGQPWRGFVDNVAIAFNGSAPIIYNFEIDNHPPAAQDIAISTLEDVGVSSTLPATDQDGNPLTFSIVANGTRGTAVISNAATGAFTYRPNLDAYGTDTLTFKANDGTADSNTAIVTVTITPVNDAPAALNQAVTTDEDTPVVVTIAGIDVDSPNLTFSLQQNPQHGTLGSFGTGSCIAAGTGSNCSLNVSYTPAPDFNGTDSFTFRVIDGSVASDIATVDMTVRPVSDTPVPQTGVVAATQNTPIAGRLRGIDPDGDLLTFAITSAPTQGQIQLINPATGEFIYNPDPGATGYDSFQFSVSDNAAASASLTTGSKLLFGSAITQSATVATGTQMIFIVAESPQFPGGNARVSVASDGTAGNGFSAGGPSLSADGRYVAFTSDASNLVTGDTNSQRDVFVHDRVTKTTSRVNVGAASAQGLGGFNTSIPTISADGRVVAFFSSMTNLVGNDTNSAVDAFVHDRTTGVTSRVSVATGGLQGTGGGGFLDQIGLSADGRFVAFASNFTNLVADDTNGQHDVFVHDRQTGVTSRVSVTATGAQGVGGSAYSPAISGDGRYVAFLADMTNLVPDDTNNATDVFVKDRLTGEVRRVSVTSNGTEANGRSFFVQISADGRTVGFASVATNLSPGRTNGNLDVYVHDMQTDATSLTSILPDGSSPGTVNGTYVSLSADGRYVAFTMDSSVAPFRNAYVHDRSTGTTRVIGLSYDGIVANAGINQPALSADGRFVGVLGMASNLVPNDTTNQWDTFVIGGVTVAPAALSVAAGGGVRVANVSFAYPGTPWTATSNASWLTITNQSSSAGNGTVSFSVAANTTGAPRAETLTIAAQTVTISQGTGVPQEPLTITNVPATAAYATTFSASTAGGSGTGAVTFAASGACSNSSGGALITMTNGAGTCTITATKAGDDQYLEATSAPVSVIATKAEQATLTIVGAPPLAGLGTSFLVTSSGGSGSGTVTFSVTGVCTNNAGGSQITMTSSTGTCSVTATKAGDSDYNSAVSSAVSVTATVPPVLVGTVTDRTTGAPLAGVAVRPAAGCVPATTTDAAGRYALTSTQVCNQANGQLRLQGAGYYAGEVQYAIANSPTVLDVTLRPGGTILQGTVTDATTQAPIAGAFVVMAASGDTPAGNGGRAFTDAAGQYRIDSSQFLESASDGFTVGSVFASAAGYFDYSQAGFNVTLPLPATRNFQMNATGVRRSITIETNPTGGTLVIDGVERVAPQRFDWTPSNSHTIAVISPQPVASGTQYAFTQWSDGGAIAHTIVVPDGDRTYTASFVTQHMLTTDVTPAGAGTITAGGWFNAGTQVSIAATPNSGYVFTGFSGDLTGTASPQSLAVNGPKSVTANFSLAIQSQAPLFVASAPTSAAYATSFTVSTSGGSGTGAVTFSTTGACTNTNGGGLISMTGSSGVCQITAFKAGDANYEDATSPSVSVAATKAPQATLSIIAPPSLTFGTTVGLSVTGGSGSGSVTFSTGASTGCSVAGAQLSVANASATCMVSAIKQGDANYDGPVTSAPATVTLVKASQTITFGPLANAKLADSPLTASATASSGLIVTFTTTTPGICTSGGSAGATITLVTLGTCTVVAHQPGDSNYFAAADVERSFAVGNGKLDQTISFAPLPNRTMIDSPFTASATSSSGLVVKFSTTTTAVCGTSGPNGSTISLLAPGTCTITAVQQGNAIYNPAPSVTQSFIVTKANQTISFAPLPDRRLADTRITVSASASSGLAVTFSTTTPTICSPGGKNGATIRLLTTGTCSITAVQGGDTRYNTATPVIRSFAVTP